MGKMKDHLIDIEELVVHAYVDLGLTDYDEIIEYVQETLELNEMPMASVADIVTVTDTFVGFMEDYLHAN